MAYGLKPLYIILFSLILVSCSSTSELDNNLRQVHTPSQWSTKLLSTTVENNWFQQFQNVQIHQLVGLALKNNFQLKQQAYAIDIQRQKLIITGSDLWPSLNMSLSNSRRKTVSDNITASYNTNVSIDLNLQYELDLWGKLSAAERQANLTLMAQQASFEQAKQQLVADVITAWFSVIEADKLLTLYQRRSENTKQNLLIIESNYQLGLNSSLDVYLTRSEVNNELARISEQKTKKVIAIRKLEQLLGQYPEGALFVEAEFPQLETDIPLGLPSDIVARKPELIASWYNLLAQNSALAYAHKQRFPSINITASLYDDQQDIADLLSTSSLAWSLIGNIAMPLFNAGKLKANEEQNRLLLKQTEQGYLASLYDAFTEVENAVSNEKSLKERYKLMIKAQNNAIAAENLAFEQYQNGLVDYITVLDAQSRSYDAQSTVIQINNQLMTNRINLHIALGGNFSTPENSKNASVEIEGEE